MNLKVDDIKLHVTYIDPTSVGYSTTVLADNAKDYLGILRLITRDGLEGHAFVGGIGTHTLRDIVPLVETIKQFLVGQDALDREWLWHQLRQMAPHWGVPPSTIMAVDVALWDLAAKAANLPVYKLLGAYQHKILAYVSAPFHAAVDVNIREALACKERGFRGYKIHHAVHDLRETIKVCTEVRKAVGDEMALMFDCGLEYSFEQALYVGRALDELNFHWYEDPVDPKDLDSLAELSRQLITPIAISDAQEFRLSEAPTAIGKQAAQILIGEPSKDGITGLKKLATLCESYRLTVNYHYGENSLLNVALLHVALSVENGNLFPILLPIKKQQFGIIQYLDIDPDGFIHGPQKSGLGVDIDWSLMKNRTEAIL